MPKLGENGKINQRMLIEFNWNT
uniref:Uncharacterized protein n=1 Tax=Anguilla anguilla TaxID=7936 RepID=A0A0E9ULN1_ANGAN